MIIFRSIIVSPSNSSPFLPGFYTLLSLESFTVIYYVFHFNEQVKHIVTIADRNIKEFFISITEGLLTSFLFHVRQLANYFTTINQYLIYL